MAAVASGFPVIPLTIFGFPPRRSKDRKTWFADILGLDHTSTFFESPHRIAATLADAADVLGERPIMLGRELTKRHQEFVRGSAQSVLDQLGQPRGEITVVVAGAVKREIMPIDQIEAPDIIARAVDKFSQLTNLGRSRRQAMTEAARAFDVPVRVVYAAVEAKKSAV
jgi:16S rRNA (cytidine1402-2'-O)-methyltransferase